MSVPQATSKTIDLGNGQNITIETGKLAKQADGSVIVKCGDTMLLATVVSGHTLRPGQDFFPLSVDYQEKFAAAGKIPGGFLRREGRIQDHEILVSRLVDRAIRPLFPDGYMFETQVLISLISADDKTMPDALAALAASAAVTVSDIPFSGPISEVRVAKIDGQYKINPTRDELGNADLEIIVAASEADIMMVEGEMNEVSEAELLEAMKVGHEAIKIQCKAQKELAEAFGKKADRDWEKPEVDEALKTEVMDATLAKFQEVARAGIANKSERKEAFGKVKSDYLDSLGEIEDEEKAEKIATYLKAAEKEGVRSVVINEGIRLDGRKTTEIRPIWIETDYLPAAHGSAVFTRGETQSLSSVTLGSAKDAQMIDTPFEHGSNNFILHYNFPAFSTGETKPNRGPSRREVGHGNLAMRSLKKVLPTGEDNPYTIRVVSDILESNGSSSMATVCAGSLSLMDAGIKIKGGVSGIAMGLIGDSNKAAILSDILGDEDHLGDMDFKVTGTKNGICACQMDMKIEGLSYDLLEKALSQAKEGRHYILEKMNKVLSEPRADFKPHVPKAEKIIIAKEFIGAIIGPGGKNIQELQATTNTTISIEEVEDTGEVTIYGTDREGLESALSKIKGITTVPEEGEVYESAVVKSVMPYGAFVEFLPGKQGLLHISEISWERIESMDGVMNEGDTVKVKLIGIDKKSGKFKLSRKVLMDKPVSSENN